MFTHKDKSLMPRWIRPLNRWSSTFVCFWLQTFPCWQWKRLSSQNIYCVNPPITKAPSYILPYSWTFRFPAKWPRKNKVGKKQTNVESGRSQLNSWLHYFINALIQVQKLIHLIFSFSQVFTRPDTQNALTPSVSLAWIDPVGFSVTPAPDLFPSSPLFILYNLPFSSYPRDAASPASWQSVQLKETKKLLISPTSHRTLIHSVTEKSEGL